MLERLERVRIVLVETTHPGNIGAAARAMKTMGLTDLRLVQPRHFPNSEAEARASGAEDVLASARVFATLEDAVSDCLRVVGTSARTRKLAWPERDPRRCGSELIDAAAEGPVALVFGRERTGLTNAELDLCTEVVIIPANPEYSSLNLGAAVQVLSYELRMAALANATPAGREPESPPATHDELERFYRHLESVLDASEFLDKRSPEQLMRRVRRLYGRAGLDRNEVQILRGMLTALAPDVPPSRETKKPENT